MPRGDITLSLAVQSTDAERAEATLREAGFAVRVTAAGDGDTEAVLAATRASGLENPGGEVQLAVLKEVTETLEARGIPSRMVAIGTTISGGTPDHAWLPVVLDGEPTSIRVLAASEAEAERELNFVAKDLGVARDRLNIAPPAGWQGYGFPEPPND